MPITTLNSAIAGVFPDQCISCGALIGEGAGLCPSCWTDTPFIHDTCCKFCAAPLPGERISELEICDACLETKRPWRTGASVLTYKDRGRGLVLTLKHRKKFEIAPVLAGWMAQRAKRMIHEDTILVPIPSHWTRLVMRGFNPAAELARCIAKQTEAQVLPNALMRIRRVEKQTGKDMAARFENQRGSIAVNPRYRERLGKRPVVLVDDVFTTGATLTAATSALLSVNVERVDVLTLARRVRDA